MKVKVRVSASSFSADTCPLTIDVYWLAAFLQSSFPKISRFAFLSSLCRKRENFKEASAKSECFIFNNYYYYYFSISDFSDFGFLDFGFPDFNFPGFDFPDFDLPDLGFPNFDFPYIDFPDLEY